jgi:hypothetical protein
MRRWSVPGEQVSQNGQHVVALELALDMDRQALRLCSSITVSMRNALPSWVRSATKS